MLYVFHVDTGTMMTFDMNLAMESVSVLQSVITRGYRIPEDKQVLLISGGESLDPAAVVGKYHAGTDTNPIFLFSKSTIESSVPPSPSVNYGSDVDLQGQVEGSLIMPPAYETVVSRAQLALQFQDVDTEELRACERLIHDQHLQQQGWAAVVANLEDITGELKQRAETFHESFKQYLECRDAYRELIASVSLSLDLLSKIPVLPSLVMSTDNMAEDGDPDEVSQLTLFDWISSQDSNHTLQDMVEQSDKATEQLDSRVEESLREDVDFMMKEVANDSMKEVKGLEDRLYGLDQIIFNARKIVQEQADLAKGFLQNQNRLSNVRDRSILPDLCSSHRNQLVEMLKNHTRLREIKKKCRLAKEELSVNLHTRLRWVMYIEKKICDVDGKLTIYLGNLRRLGKRLDILQQVQDAPKVYAKLVLEVVRRKQFSTKFHSWACNLADESGRLQTEEVKRREIFLRIIGHHFLQSMFPGLEDCPPSFATQAPEVFDVSLPEITVDDVNELKDSVPELLEILSEPVEDDWLLFTNLKDSSEPWLEESTGHSLHNFHAIPTNRRKSHQCVNIRSDTNITFEPYSVDNGSISLGDQFTECEQDEDITQKPEFFSFSPPDKDFMLAKSLSEELTKEMKEANCQLKQQLKTSASADILLVQSIVTEDTVLHAPSMKLRKPSMRKSLSETSPDLETSQEFQTLDCYIDESMPSSIESPPKPVSERKASLEECLTEEKKNNAKLLQELNLCNKKVSDSEEKINLLQKIVSDNLLILRSLVEDLKKDQLCYVRNVLSEFEHVKNELPEVIKMYNTYAEANQQSAMEHLQLTHSDSLEALNKHIINEKKYVMELEKKVKEMEQERIEKEKDLKIKLDNINKEKEDMGACLARDVQNLTLKHELELEVEMDRVKAEHLAIIATLEQDLESKNSTICDKECEIKTIQAERDRIEEKLNDKFLKEKERICGILHTEHDEKLKQAIKEQQEKVEFMKQSVVAELVEKHKKEKEQALELAQSSLSLAYTNSTEEIKAALQKEKDDELRIAKTKLESDFLHRLDQLKCEFVKQKDSLEAELKHFKEITFQKEELEKKLNNVKKVALEKQNKLQEVNMKLKMIADREIKTVDVQTDYSLGDTKIVETQTDHETSCFETNVPKSVVYSISPIINPEPVIQSDLVEQTEAVKVCNKPTQTDDWLYMRPASVHNDETYTELADESQQPNVKMESCRTSTARYSDAVDVTKEILQKEFDQRISELERSRAELENHHQVEMESSRAELEECHQVEMESSRAELEEHHQLEMERSRAELEEHHQVEMERSRAELEKRHQVEMERSRAERKERRQVEMENSRAELEKHHQVEMERSRAELEKHHQVEMERSRAELEEHHQVEMERSRAELELHHQLEMERSRAELEECHQVEMESSWAELEKHHQVEMESIRAELENHHQLEMERSTAELEECHQVEMERSRAELEARHQVEIERSRAEMEKHHQVEMERSRAELQERHQVEIEGSRAQLEREKEEVQQLKCSLTALIGDKQTKFNEALTRVCREKDKVIEEMKLNEHSLEEKIKQTKEEIQALLEEKCNAEDVKERALSLLKEKEREFGSHQWQLENQLHLCQQELNTYKEQVFSMAGNSEHYTLSSPSVVNISDPELPNLQQRIQDLEQEVKCKEEQISKMQQKVMELSMSASTRSLVQDKVSITSCQVGDLVLLCLDERLNQYVVFTVGSTLHFLHTECLPQLGLKPEPGQPKKQWLIAEVMEKEYCQAKKATNRFNVPVGTKFYRVKARQWSRETSQASPAKNTGAASH